MILSIITIVALPVALGTLYYQYQAHKQAKELAEKTLQIEEDRKIQNFVDKYMELRNALRDGGYSGVFSAGINSLESSAQIIKACEIIQNWEGKNPLQQVFDLLEPERIKEYVTLASKKGSPGKLLSL